jgi:hypothetical protein
MSVEPLEALRARFQWATARPALLRRRGSGGFSLLTVLNEEWEIGDLPITKTASHDKMTEVRGP